MPKPIMNNRGKSIAPLEGEAGLGKGVAVIDGLTVLTVLFSSKATGAGVSLGEGV